MSVQTEIERLKTAKADLKAAIEEKGITVPEAATLDGYGALVSQISGGGGSIRAFSYDKPIGTSTMTIRQMDGQTITLTSAADNQTVGGIFFSCRKMNWDLSATETVFYSNRLYFAGEFIKTCLQEQEGGGGWLQFSS